MQSALDPALQQNLDVIGGFISTAGATYPVRAREPVPSLSPRGDDTWRNLAGNADVLYMDATAAAARAACTRCVGALGPRTRKPDTPGLCWRR